MDRNFAMQNATYEPIKELLQNFITHSESGTFSKRGIGFNVPLLTGRGCVLVHPAKPNGRPTLTRVLLPVGRRPAVTIFLFSNFPWGLQDKKTKLILKGNYFC